MNYYNWMSFWDDFASLCRDALLTNKERDQPPAFTGSIDELVAFLELGGEA